MRTVSVILGSTFHSHESVNDADGVVKSAFGSHLRTQLTNLLPHE